MNDFEKWLRSDGLLILVLSLALGIMTAKLARVAEERDLCRDELSRRTPK